MALEYVLGNSALKAAGVSFLVLAIALMVVRKVEAILLRRAKDLQRAHDESVLRYREERKPRTKGHYASSNSPNLPSSGSSALTKD